MPLRLRIGAQWWRVRRRELDPDGRDYGWTEPRRLLITLAPRQAAGQLRDTLLHEVLHACWSQCALDVDADTEERIVGALAPWLLLTLRENSELVEFLLAAE